MEKDLTTGSVRRNIVISSLPYLLSYFCRRCMVWQICLSVIICVIAFEILKGRRTQRIL